MKILMAIALSASIISGLDALDTDEKMDHTDMPPCQGKPIGEQCRALFPYVGYTFDAYSKTCKKFRGSGCGMTGNGFRSMEECQLKCISQPKKEGEFCGRCLHTDCPDSCPRGICGKCEEGLVCKEDFLVIPYRRSPVANPLGKCVNQTVSKPKKEGEFCGPCYGAECPDSCPPMVMRNGMKKSEPPTKAGQCGKCEKGLVCLPFYPWIRHDLQSRKMMPYPLNKCVNRTVSNPKKEGEFCGDCLGKECPDSCPQTVDYRGIRSCGKCEKGLMCIRTKFPTTMRNQSKRKLIHYPLGKCVNQTATECKNKLTDKQCKKIKKAKKCNKGKGMKECKKTCGLCDDGKCKNNKNDKECKKMKKNCKDPDVMKDCKKTCGLCDDGKCKNNKTDKQCKKMKKNCKDPEVMKDCKKTCSLCDDGKCKNNKQDKACMKMKKRCEEPKVMKNCKKTCGLCDDGMADF